MELLIAILLKLGFFYTPETLCTKQNNGTQSAEVILAQHILDEHLYYFEDDGGIVIEDDVDPNN